METVLILLGVVVVAFVAIVLAIRNLIYICGPNECLIFAGGGGAMLAGRRMGYRIIKGGRGIRVPMLERVARLDLTNMIIDLRVTGAYSKGGIPLIVEGVANMKIAGEEPVIHNAIERFMGKDRAEVMRIAKDTLEGNLRGVLATLTPEEVNEDKIAFSRSLLEESSDDLARLGLALDTLQVQNISDDVSYLDSIGRKQGAELIRDARIAEADNKTQAVVRAAENQRETAFAKIEAGIEKARAEARRRVTDAQTRRAAMVAEVQAEVGAELARANAQLAVQSARIIEVESRLEADIVAPAEALAKRRKEEAKADAAKAVEDGKALAKGLEELVASWKTAGPAAKDIFLMQKLQTLLRIMISAVDAVDIEQLTVIDGALDNGAIKATSALKQLEQAAGVDVAGLVGALAAGKRLTGPTRTATPIG